MSSTQNNSGLVPAICTQCGAQLKVNPNSRVTTCTSCGTEFVTQQAITNYNIYITNNTTINQTVVGKKGAVQSVLEYLDHAGERSHAAYMEQLRREEEERRKAEESRKSCLFVIGLFTVPYIAIPVYIASKNKEKRAAEEVQRQQLAAAESEARERARVQAQERLREIQAKRPSATEISALIQQMKDVRCPSCDAPIEIKIENPTVQCVYCESVLIDAHYSSSLTIRDSYNIGDVLCSCPDIKLKSTYDSYGGTPPRCENCYFQSGINSTLITPLDGVKEKSKPNMQKSEFATALGPAFVFVEDDYPKLAWELGILLGDVDLDEKVDNADAMQLKKALMTEIELNSKAAYLADLNYNGVIDAIDLTLLKRMLIS